MTYHTSYWGRRGARIKGEELTFVDGSWRFLSRELDLREGFTGGLRTRYDMKWAGLLLKCIPNMMCLAFLFALEDSGAGS